MPADFVSRYGGDGGWEEDERGKGFRYSAVMTLDEAVTRPATFERRRRSAGV
jgi:hypothetical protein